MGQPANNATASTAASSEGSAIASRTSSSPSLGGSGNTCDWFGGAEEPLDLALVHHRLQLPVSRWPAIRRQVPRVERPTSVRLPEHPFPQADHEHQHVQECRDHLTHAVAAGTLFLVGSRTAFELESGAIQAVAEDWPAQIARGKKALRLQEEITAEAPWSQGLWSQGSGLAICSCDQHYQTHPRS